MRRKVPKEAVPRELLPGISQELLKALHLVTRDGAINADSLRKVKQVNHLLRQLTPAMEDVLARFGDPVVVDCGAGKGYLGFLLHEYFLRKADKGTVVGIESRPELVRACKELAAALHLPRMRFVEGRVDEVAGQAVETAGGTAGQDSASETGGEPRAEETGETPRLPERAHLVTALHACDTATDDAIVLALRHNADHVALVPCCQAEVARQLESRKDASPAFGALWEHPWHRREFGSHLTNVLRVLVLESRGYRVTVTELTGWEHSLKNELILGKRVRKSDQAARARLDALLAETGVRPKVVRALDAVGL